MPIAAYAIPQTGSFVAEPQYGGSTKWGASYTAAPPYASYQPEYSMYGSATPPFPYGHTYGHTYGSAPAPCTPPYPHYAMPSTASFTYEQPTQHTYQMPTTASFTCDQPAQPYSYQQQQAASQSFYAMPQQASFTAYPQPANYSSMADRCQFQFYPSAAYGADGQAKTTGPEHAKPTGPMNHSPLRPEQAMPTGPVNQMPAEPSQVKPAGPMNHAPAGPGRAKSPMPKPNSSTSKRPPAKKTAKKSQGCCSCGV